MKEYIKGIPLTTIILLYLFLCGGIYLFAYWGTFDINMQEWVSVWEIPKSFILPFAISSSIYIVLRLTIYTFSKAYNIAIVRMRKKPRSGFLTILYSLSFILILVLYIPLRYNIIYWLLSLSWVVIPIMKMMIIYSMKYDVVKSNRNFFEIIMGILLITPFAAFLFGKIAGVSVYNNDAINTINKKIVANITDTSKISSIKFLGSLGDKFIVSDLENEKIFFLNQGAFEGLEIQTPRDFRVNDIWRYPLSQKNR